MKNCTSTDPKPQRENILLKIWAQTGAKLWKKSHTYKAYRAPGNSILFTGRLVPWAALSEVARTDHKPKMRAASMNLHREVPLAFKTSLWAIYLHHFRRAPQLPPWVCLPQTSSLNMQIRCLTTNFTCSCNPCHSAVCYSTFHAVFVGYAKRLTLHYPTCNFSNCYASFFYYQQNQTPTTSNF